jgi:NAD(P)H-flavin reductase/hemoglobin-like flavoprotein
LKKSLAQLEPASERLMAYAFAIFFVRHPELRAMFPLAQDAQRQRVFAALARYVWASDRPESVTGWLSELARDHGKYGVAEHHFKPFCDALLVALRAYSGGAWSPQTGAAWENALDHMAATMARATRECAADPAWWLAEVTGHEVRCPGVAVLTLRPDRPLPCAPGQHVSVQVPRWPRHWREYSAANARDPGDPLHLHVRAVPGGTVSAALVYQTQPGDTLVLGPARGGMTSGAVPRHGGGTVLCFAGGTGLAPLKAIAQALCAGRGGAPVPQVGLYFGARREADLYDLADLRRMQSRYPALTVTPVVCGEPGALAHIAASRAAALSLSPGPLDVFVCGPPAMVAATTAAVSAHAPDARLHFDPP